MYTLGFLAFLTSHFIDSPSKADVVVHWAAAWIIQRCSLSASVVHCTGKDQWRERVWEGPALFSTPVAKRVSYVRQRKTRMTSPGTLLSCVPHPGTYSRMSSGPSSPSLDRYFKGTIIWVSICAAVFTQIVIVTITLSITLEMMLKLLWQQAFKMFSLLKVSFKVNLGECFGRGGTINK